MKDLPLEQSSPRSPDASALVLYRRIPLAYGIFLTGFIVSALVSRAGQPMTWEHLIMSDLLSPIDNPRGYLLAVGATAGCAILLLPIPGLLGLRASGTRSIWSMVASWLYRIGLLASIAIAITTPLQAAYDPFHVHLALVAFTGMSAGLALTHLAPNPGPGPLRQGSPLLGSLHVAALLFLTLVFLKPDFFHGRRWFLGLCEWLLAALIGSGTFFAVLRVRTTKPSPERRTFPLTI